ncbi:aldehyde dehydrogenase family protein [Actinoalloteichus hymeniacidonis]|uniref:aldehyde dehydrogenase (NAD(+)) n=1 Tax=Actinoalloteichus hymeniacidonis TaxID=340345 RepID=A0AAC9HNF9_9PSEU|nr:aldehyde dehydrogenase family protein [Actinoalloteichus hymeniacidonis]AOS62403.1 NAD-dependent aldehyde dehydrogenase [Actinoalloteichus hymeniacidonis]MBB5909566.1 aldehyde dehydrogenase (NAD+) [Actinoalloteichus hymeniacidonis]
MTVPVATSTGHLIGGQTVTDGDGWIEVVNPATGRSISTIPAGTAAQVDAAVRAAADAWPAWAATPATQRAAIVRRLSSGIAARADELASVITAEMGSPITFATKVQAALPAATSASIADLIDGGYSFTEEIGNSLITREPVGVVGCITPWNYPLHQLVAKVAPALAAGCTVVVKPSELAPVSAGLFAEIVATAGVPAGVVNIVHGTGPVVGEALVTHPLVDMVSFTGSVAAGSRVAALAAGTIKKVSLELGGKSANVILDDADLTKSVKIGVANCFLNAGQTCTAWSRMLVPQRLHDQAVELVQAAAARYVPADPTDPATKLGPLASQAQRERVLGYIRSGIDAGARLVAGGVETPSDLGEGSFVQATVFADVRPEMTIAKEEIFGPVLSIMPYQDDDDAVRIANSTDYGLSGAVFSADSDRALAVAGRLRTGQVDINGAAFNPLAPFGGYRRSGVGRELGRFGLEEFLEVKSIQR